MRTYSRWVLLCLCIMFAVGCAGAFEQGNRLYYKERDFAKALEAYMRVPKESPLYATAQRYIGYNIYGREWGQWQDGLPYLEEALRSAPDDPKVLEDIGRAYIKVGKVRDGVELLKKADTDVARRALRRFMEK